MIDNLMVFEVCTVDFSMIHWQHLAMISIVLEVVAPIAVAFALDTLNYFVFSEVPPVPVAIILFQLEVHPFRKKDKLNIEFFKKKKKTN